jgi:hypothetical protein
MLKILETMLLLGVHGHFTYSTSTWPCLWKYESLRKFLFELLEWENEGEREEEEKNHLEKEQSKPAPTVVSSPSSSQASYWPC